MEARRLLFIGDSLIDYGSWPQRLPAFGVISRGIPGETSTELLQRLPAVLDNDPADAIILMTGTNDLFVSIADFAATISYLTTTVRSIAPSTRLILHTLPRFPLPGLETPRRVVNESIIAAAHQGGYPLCDLQLAFATAQVHPFSFDGVHFSESGYQIWTTELLTILNRLAFTGD